MDVYIVLTDTGTLFTRLIKLFTKQPLNHASMSFSKELDVVYSFGRKRPNNPFIGGFVKEDMKGKLFKDATCAVYSCSVSTTEYQKMQRFIQGIEQKQYHYKYNFKGLFGVLLKKEMKTNKAFFCSEFVATVLNTGGIAINKKPARFVKPNDFMESGNFKLIYKGNLSAYLNHQFEESNRLICSDKTSKIYLPFVQSIS